MWFLLLGCPRSISPVLELEPTPTAAEAAAPEPTEPAARMAWMLAGDPLARRPNVPRASVPDPLSFWVGVANQPAPRADAWWGLERTHPGTIVVPLARGGRLAALETHLGDVEAALDDTLPLIRSPNPRGADARPPLAWLGASSTDALLPVVERSVLLGWMDAPTIDVTAVGALLRDDRWARLGATRAGTLLRARTEGRRDAARGAAGAADLALATSLMIEFVAADTATERTAAQAESARVLTTLGATSGDPITLLLARSLPALTDDAGNDTSTGLALVTMGAMRWRKDCGADPCGGLDQVGSIHAARRWGATPAAVAAVWEVAALKDARDHLDAAYTRASFPAAAAELADVLVGLDPLAPIDRGILARPSPDATLHLAVSRAADHRDATDAKGMFEALDARLKREIAAARAVADPRQAVGLDRMTRRLTR